LTRGSECIEKCFGQKDLILEFDNLRREEGFMATHILTAVTDLDLVSVFAVDRKERLELEITLGILRVLHSPPRVEESQRVAELEELSGMLRTAKKREDQRKKKSGEYQVRRAEDELFLSRAICYTDCVMFELL
jgi:hypothetical protein